MSSTVLCQSKSCINGNPPSRLECPTCNKLRIPNFLSICINCADCLGLGSEVPSSADKNVSRAIGYTILLFHDRGSSSLNLIEQKKSHKVVHELAKNGRNLVSSDGSYDPFPNYPFTGSVRPVYPLSKTRVVPDHIPKPDYAESGFPLSESRQAGQPPRILSKEEQAKMRTVCRLAREILDIAASHIRPGITTDELDEIVHQETIKRNGYPSPLNYRQFPKSVCTSVNEVICHGIPDRRKLEDGDIINIDVTLYYDGYHGDVNETYPVGKIDEESQKLLRVARQSLDEAIKICKPGALFRDVGKAIEPIARSSGCSTVRTYTGHGINDLFHCAPNVPHYAKNKAVGTMKPGMVFTIEPMINLGSNWGDVHWPDNWTATTVDGQRSAQFEETLLITESGVEILTAKR